jgi:hypothetical protein
VVTCSKCRKQSPRLVMRAGLCGQCHDRRTLPLKTCARCGKRSSRLVLRAGLCGRCHAADKARPVSAARALGYKEERRRRVGGAPVWLAFDHGEVVGVFRTRRRADAVSTIVREYRMDQVRSDD